MNMVASIAGPGIAIREITTPLGLTAWLVEDHTVPLVAMRFAFRGGAAQDDAKKAGTAYMLSGLLDEGAGDLDAQAFHEKLEELAVELSFSAERDAFGGSLRTLTRHAGEAFALARLALNEPRFDADAIERVRGQIMAGLKHELKNPDAIGGRVFAEHAYPGHPYGRAVQGTLQSIPTITRDDLTGMKQRLLARDNLVISMVGAISAQDAAAAVDQIFGGLPTRAHLHRIPDVAFAGTGTRHGIDFDIPQSVIMFGRQGIARNDDDFIPAMIANHIFGGGVFQSRLFKEVREKRGLTYSVYSSLASFDHAAMLFGGTSTKNERAEEALRVIGEEIEKFRQDGPTETEVDKAKKYLTGSYALRFDTSSKIAGQLVQIQLESLGIDWMQRRNGLIQAVTCADVVRAAQRILGDGKLLVTLVGRPGLV
ncbi:MAG: M16 family metallopeptidase [Beijerinckiaceae bacterium]